jgi:outer membrane protein TolC
MILKGRGAVLIGLESSADTMSTASGGGGSLFSTDSFNYFFSPSFAWKIFNYGRLRNRVSFEYSVFCQRMISYQNTVLLAYREVEDGLITFIKTQDEADLLAKSVSSAQRAAELARNQYVEGLDDYTRVLETDRTLVDQEEQHAISRGNIALSLIRTYRALGGGW